MSNCDICQTTGQELSFTRCCKTLVCTVCAERQDKKLVCSCGKVLPQGKKNYMDCPEVMGILRKYWEEKVKECDRCDNKAEYQCCDCDMFYCPSCNSQVHAGLGFSKHSRRVLGQTMHSPNRQKQQQILCPQHSQQLISGCDCGTPLCPSCLKQHKQTCLRGNRIKPLKEFKQQYFLNMLIKMRQLSYFKQRLTQDTLRYQSHFQIQKTSFQASQQLINQQMDYLRKMIEIKYSEINAKLNQYWVNCQHIYRVNQEKIKQQVRKYDSYAELLPKFGEHLTSLEYFEKKIKKFNLNFQFTNIKNLNVEQAQNSIMNIGIVQKAWELPLNQTTLIQVPESRTLAKDEVRLLGSLHNTSQMILDYTQDPLKDRQLNLLPSHSEIYYSFIHLPFQNVKYEVQYGVGMKMKGYQIFKNIQNPNGFGYIEGLNPNTTYRVRMRVADGQWGPISQVITLDIPRFNIDTSSFAKQVGQNVVQLGKGGLIYGSNQINFGVHRWVIKLTSKTISYQDSETACMSVGVSNKQTKKATFAGTTFNYGYQKSQIVLKVVLDCNEKRLAIINSSTNQQEVYQNLPNFPLFPTLQNKGNGQIQVRYNLSSDDSNSC